VCDIAERPLQVALRVGADRALRSDLGQAAELADSVDVALECAGSPAALTTCLQAVRRGGRIVQVGTLGADSLAFPANQVMARELDYVGSFRFGIEFDWAVRYLRERRIDVRPLLTAQFPLANAVEAFALAADRGRSTKVQLVCD
jgi:L-idonate 5-dehydrogenase